MYIFTFEEKWYSENDLSIKDDFIDYLEDNAFVERKERSLKFIFVGIIARHDEVLIILPKFYASANNDRKDYIEETKTIIKLFKSIPKPLRNEYSDALYIEDDIENDATSEIAIADFLIQDYIKNGLLERTEVITKKTNQGSIDWNKTINKTQPFVSSGNVVYLNTFRKQKVLKEDELIIRLHKLVLNLLISKYQALLDIDKKVQDTEKIQKRINSLGDKKEFLTIIEKELEKTYDQRNILVLKALYNFFLSKYDSKTDDFQLYGTSQFEIIWEEICSKALSNELSNYTDLIEVPIWKSKNGQIHEAQKNKLKIDIIKTVTYKNNNYFLVIDAKYRKFRLTEDKLTGQPGSYDLIKQYAYKLALKDKVNYDVMLNIFIYPKLIKKTHKFIGSVNLDFMGDKPILNFYFSPKELMKMYIKNKSLSEDMIYLMLKSVETFY